MRWTSLGALVSFPVLVACGSSAESPVLHFDAPPAPSTFEPSADTSSSEAETTVASFRTDEDDPTADELCNARERAGAQGQFEADDRFPVAGALGVTARVDGEKLLLDFPWPSHVESYVDQPSQRWEYASTLSLSGGGALQEGSAEVEVWDEGPATRSCTKAGAERRGAARTLLSSKARLDVVWRSEAEVGGTITIDGSVLTFTAPFARSPLADSEVCCLKIRRMTGGLPGPVFSNDEHKALCALRDKQPPHGTFTVSPELGFEKAIDIVAEEHAHPFRPSLTITLHYPHERGRLEDGAPSETNSWSSFHFSNESEAPLNPRFTPGSYAVSSAGTSSGSMTCARNSGSGVSGYVPATGVTMMITKREGERIEGFIEMANGTPTPSRLTFATVVNPPPRVSLCCLDE